MPHYYFQSVSCSGRQTCPDPCSVQERRVEGVQEGQLVACREELTGRSFSSAVTGSKKEKRLLKDLEN